MNDLKDCVITCPYCGEQIQVLIEFIGEPQEYIEDCQVCCCPIVFHIAASEDDINHVSVSTENEVY